MNAIGLNPIKLDAIGLDPIRMNAIRLGVPVASSGSGRPYIDPELLSHVKMAISTWGKTNDDPDRAVLKDLSGNGNDMRLLNFGFAGNSGYGLYSANYMDYTSNEMQLSVHTSTKISGYNQTSVGRMAIKLLVYTLDNIPSYKIKVTNLVHTIRYYYIDPDHSSIRTSFTIKTNGIYELPASRNDLYNGESIVNVGFAFDGNGGGATIEQIPDFEGWLCTDGVEDLIESVKPVSEMLEGSNEITVVSIIHYFDTTSTNTIVRTNFAGGLGSEGNRWKENRFDSTLKGKTGIYGWSSKDTGSSQTDVINNILGDKNDYRVDTNIDNAALSSFSVVGLKRNDTVIAPFKVAYAGGFIANKVLTTDETNQIIAYFNLDRPGQIIKPQLYCNIKKQGITNENHTEFNDQLIDFINGHNIQLNNIGWEGESGIIDGALYLDGINDFGKVTGLPVLKDYTVVADRKILGNNGGGTLSKSYSAGNGAFIFETGSVIYSFGTVTSGSGVQSKRMLSYLSKYIYNGNPIQAGTGVDSDSMWLGTVRDDDPRFSKFALWSLMLFPYSLSEFLLERQLRKYKAGTLYPNMVEFRPIVRSNKPYLRVLYFMVSTGEGITKGSHIPIGSKIQINIATANTTDEISSVTVNGKEIELYTKDEEYWRYRLNVTKSPQKINIVISSYLTMLGNDTLISNETLIKNE